MKTSPPYRRPRLGFAQPRVWLLAVGCLLLGFWLGRLPEHPTGTSLQANSTLQVYFSPDGGATHALVHLIQQARRQVQVQAYSFTSRPLLNALIAAHDRGVNVRIILDRSHVEKRNYRTGHYTPKISAALAAFYSAGVPVWIDDHYLIAHNKVMLIDGRIIVTGSFNFSYAAAHFNAENMLVLRNVPALFARYEHNFQYHLRHSPAYRPGLVLTGQFHWPRWH